MNTRMKSPSYPSMSLEEAIESTEKLFRAARSNPVDRAVAAQAMGYTGLTGRSGKVLSNLSQFGLIEKAGKNEVKVSRRALEIFHPDSPADKAAAIVQAAYEPELFAELRDRGWAETLHEGAIRSYLFKNHFTDVAIPPAIRAFVDTCRFAQQFLENESHRSSPPSVKESLLYQGDMDGEPLMTSHAQGPFRGERLVASPNNMTEPQFNNVAKGVILLGGAVRSRADAEYVIAMMTAMKSMLPEAKQATGDGDEGAA